MIYLFNQTEELIDVIDEATLAEFTHTIELNQFDRASFEVPIDYKPEIIKKAQFFGFQSRDRAFCLFRISEKSYDIGLTIQGIDRAESDLNSFIIADKRPSGTADQVLTGILEGTGYQLGNVDGLTRTGKMSFYYISVRQALVKIIESYACEFKIRYTFVENKIIGRYIDLNQRFGRVTGHQFEYGSNILNVTYEESSDDVVTALIGRGKGEESTNDAGEATGGYGRRIQFKDVVWTVSNGDPVDKPAGQNYVTNEAARNIYGLHQNGVIKHRFGVYTNEDIEDPVELLKATYKELQRLSVPIVTFKANLLDLANAIEQDVWIGDSIGIVRDQIGIAFEARIHKLTIDKLDDNRSVAELGDYQTLQAKDRATRQQAIIDVVSGFSESLFEKSIANETERLNKEFDEKIRVSRLEFDNAVKAVEAKAEENKKTLSDEIDQRLHDFSPAGFEEAKTKAEEALRKAGASDTAIQEAKRISERVENEFNTFQTGYRADLNGIDLKIASSRTDAQRMFGSYVTNVEGRFARLVSQLSGKVNQTDFQRVQEISQLYERIIGSTEQDVSDKVARMTMTSQIFQTEIEKKLIQGGPNMIRNSRADDGLDFWTWYPNKMEVAQNPAYFNGQKNMFLLKSGAVTGTQRFIFKKNTDYTLNFLALDNNSARVRISLRKRTKESPNTDFDQNQVIFEQTGSPIFASDKIVKRSFTFNTGDFDDGYLLIEYLGSPAEQAHLYMTEFDLYEGKNDRVWQPAPEDNPEVEAVKTKVTQLASSWAVQNLTSAGSIASQINTNANNILIEASKIRLKGSTLADEITAIDGRFKRLFVGEGNFATLNTDVLRANSISGDKLAIDQAFINKLVASDVFTNTLSAKSAFITKMRSNIVSANLFEGYKGRIGGFQLGVHDKDPNSYWLTGLNHFRVGMGDGSGDWNRTALWVNWGDTWEYPGKQAWFVKNNGKMYCYNQAEFWSTPKIHGDLNVSGNIYYVQDNYIAGFWMYSDIYTHFSEKSGYVYMYKQGGSYSWIPVNKEISDRRYKTNIEDSQVSALDVIDNLKTYSYRKEFEDKIEDISCGIMAQDVQKYAPEAFYENPDGVYSYNTFALVPYLIKAIQELNQKLEEKG